jgi:hypothetical protein
VTFCVALDDAGRLFIDRHDSWSIIGQPTSASTFPNVSCTPARFCVVSSGSSIITYNGRTWSKPVELGPYDSFGDMGVLFSLTCTSADFCMGGGQVSDQGALFQYNGTRWRRLSAQPIGAISSVSCTSASFCVAGDQQGNAYIWGGKSWSDAESIDANQDGIVKLSCASATFCVEVDHVGDAAVFRAGSWSKPRRIDPKGFLTSVSCPSTHLCVAGDNYGEVVLYDGTAWSAPSTIDHGQYDGLDVSCASPSFCIAVDGNGRVVVGRAE